VLDFPQSPATGDSQEEGDKVQAKPNRSTPGIEPSACQSQQHHSHWWQLGRISLQDFKVDLSLDEGWLC